MQVQTRQGISLPRLPGLEAVGALPRAGGAPAAGPGVDSTSPLPSP